MSVHRIARDDLDQALLALVRGGEAIDHLDLDEAADEWVVITVDRIETRNFGGFIAYGAGAALRGRTLDGRYLSDAEIQAIEAQP